MKLKIFTLVVSFMLLSANTYASPGEHNKDLSTQQINSVSIGQPGKIEQVTRIIKVDMKDSMRFFPSSVSVKRGETIKFIVKNSGKINHEMVLGNPKTLREHADMMRKMPEMEHEEENQISVEPGKTGEIVWKFTNTGIVDFACLKPGHLEAGMKGKLIVKK